MNFIVNVMDTETEISSSNNNNNNNGVNYKILFDNGYINYESPICMFISAILWRLLYLTFRILFPERSKEFSSRICSSIHGCLAAFMGINQCFLFDWPFDHPEWKTSYVQSFILNMSFGYFVHDMLWMWKYDSKDRTMVGHHVVCVWSLTQIILKGYSGAQCTCGLGSMEITNPFLQARWFLRTAEMHKGPCYASIELTFFIAFFIIRIIFGTYFYNIIIQHPKNEWDFILMSTGIYIISWIFLYDIIKCVLRKYV